MRLSSLMFFLPTRDYQLGLVRISIISALTTLLFVLIGVPYFPGGAHHFIDYANYFLNHQTLYDQAAQRDAGYPLLLLLTGLPFHHQFYYLMAVQAAFAYLLPMLVYLMVDSRFPRTAFAAAVITIFTLVPYNFMKWFHHDQLYLFAVGLMALLYVRFVQAPKPAGVYTTGAAAFLATITRPAGNITFPLLLLLMVIFRPRSWKHCVACLVLFVSGIGLYQHHRHAAFGVTDTHPMPSYTGTQLFYDLYINSIYAHVVIAPQIGPHMQKLYDLTEDSLKPTPQTSPLLQGFIQSMRNAYSSEFEREAWHHDTKTLMRLIFEQPNYEYMQYFYVVTQDDSIPRGAALEVLKAYPQIVAAYLPRNLGKLFFDPGYSWTRGNFNGFAKEGMPPYPIWGGMNAPPGYLTPNATAFFTHIPTEHEMKFLASLSQGVKKHQEKYYHRLTRITAGLMLFGAVIALLHFVLVTLGRRQIAWLDRATMHGSLVAPTLGLFYLFFYNAFMSAAFAEPSYRYHFLTVLPQFPAGGYGFIMLANLLSHRLPTLASRLDGVSGRMWHDWRMRCVHVIFAASIVGWCIAMVRMFT